jgi:hypothetical protein
VNITNSLFTKELAIERMPNESRNFYSSGLIRFIALDDSD